MNQLKKEIKAQELLASVQTDVDSNRIWMRVSTVKKTKDRLKDNWQFYFLSPQMEIFKSIKAGLDYITSQPDTYSQEDYERMKNWIEEEQRSRRGENYEWHDHGSLPQGWKMRKVTTNSNNIREFFLTPDGDHIAGRRKAIEVMKEKGIYDQKIIAKMVKEMKRVSQKNHGKSTQCKKKKEDSSDDEGHGDEWGQGQLPAGSDDWQDDSIAAFLEDQKRKHRNFC